MGLFDWIGEAIGNAFHALAEFIGDAFKAIARPIMGEIISSVDDSIPKMNQEAAVRSIDVKMFRTQEFQDLVTELKKRLEHSPGGVADWFQDTLGGIFGGFYDILIGAITPSEIKNFDDAKKGAGYLVFLGIDLVLLVAVLDVIATALSATLIRNLSHIGGLFIATLGFDRLAAATIGPAINAGLIPQLTYGFNEQYQAMIPGATDLVRFQLREVWDKTRRPELLQEGTSVEYNTFMAKQGFNREQSDNYWASHWVLPSVMQLNDMLHRGVIDKSTWNRFIKYNDYDPKVRPWLEAISYEPYTRVDVRRMWELGLVTDKELTKTYLDLGYDEEHAKRLALWTKIYVLVPDLRARYQKGWISANKVAETLIAEGMPEDKVDNYMEQIVKADQPARVTAEKDLTKAEIIKGVTKNILSEQDAIDMLMQMGYTQDEAEYIVLINTQAAAGSPETYSEYQNIINKHQKALGGPTRKIPQALIEVEKQLNKYQQVLQEATRNKENQEFLDYVNKQINTLKRQQRHIIENMRK